jgi:uncharacterized protein YqhQ
MVRNLFQLYSFHTSTNENNSGGKIIQFSDHKHKSEHKKHKLPATRGHIDSLARSVKNQQSSKPHNHNSYKQLSRAKKNSKTKFSLASTLFYVFAVCSILFGIFILFGGSTFFIK